MFKVQVSFVGINETKARKPEKLPIIPRKDDIVVLADKSVVSVVVVEVYSKDLGLDYDARIMGKLVKK